MAREQFAVAELIMNMILGKTEGISRVDFTPQKKKFPFDQPYEQAFERATPESQGISSDYLAKMLRELDASKFTDVHHLLILRHGRVICECNFAPYRSGIWHITHSMCKSITGMAVGMLIDEGKLSLDENIYKIFEGRMSFLAKVFSSEVTVENLLTMTSGVQFNETGMISGNDWLRSYLSAPLAGRPGAEFQYNSLNTYVLSAIVTERTGMTLEEYLRPRLFEPMGITKYFWETCPKGITKGGWGLFLCPEDMAKLGQLYLQKGKWNGVQLVPAEWVELSTKKHVNTGEDTYGYGYQIWMESRPGSFEFNGMLGQNVIVYPDLDMVLVLCAGNNELFQNCVMLNIVRKYFGEEFEQQTSAPKASGTDGGLSSVPGAQATLPENPCAQMLLRRLCAELEMGKTGPIVRKGGWKQGRCRRHGVPDAHSWMKMLGEDKPCGRTYVLSPQNVGLFPLLIQVGHNNMTEGIRRIRFSYEKGEFFVFFEEGGEWHKILVGFGRAKETWLTLHEESYLLGTLGEFARDENGTVVLKLTMTYLEEAVRRKVNIFFKDEENIELRWFETPGKGLIMEGLESVTDELANRLLYAAMKDNRGMDVIHRLMCQTIEPVVEGRLEPGAEAVQAEDV